ncbi:VOC family protein [Actinomyces dentalis]|uniref:VOC family protein n=1 Tax=Actinomyces dentalis TaxID=272548 RepID=UPI0028ECDF8E|nr:VOC family protein [Actinomyces dentalis]
MRITGIDHVVLTVASVEVSVDFYSRVLGLDVVTFGRGRTALRLGDQKINLHPADAPIAPHAARRSRRPAPGRASRSRRRPRRRRR